MHQGGIPTESQDSHRGVSIISQLSIPHDIRVDGRIYSVPLPDVDLVSSRGRYFYRIGKRDIVIEDEVREGSVKIDKVYETSPECVICMGEESTHVFAPCGHYCVCGDCGKMVDKCPICRGPIKNLVHRDMVE